MPYFFSFPRLSQSREFRLNFPKKFVMAGHFFYFPSILFFTPLIANGATYFSPSPPLVGDFGDLFQSGVFPFKSPLLAAPSAVLIILVPRSTFFMFLFPLFVRLDSLLSWKSLHSGFFACFPFSWLTGGGDSERTGDNSHPRFSVSRQFRY